MRATLLVRGLAVLLAALLLAAVVAPRLPVAARARERFFITRKSHLYDAGVTLQGPQMRALMTGMR
jgi:hypothetical protein